MKDLFKFLELLFSETDFTKLIKNILLHTKDLVGADRCTLFLYDPEENVLESIFITGNNIGKIKLPVSKGSIAGYTFLTDKVVNIKNVYDKNELRKIDKELKHDKTWDKIYNYRTKSIIAVPIKRGNQKLGVLELLNKEPYFTKEDIKIIKNISKFISIALENAINFLKILQKQEEEKMIIENIAEAVSITDLNLKIIEVNSSFMEMIGFRYSLDDIKDKKITDILEEFKNQIEEKANIVKRKSIPTEINSELIKIKMIPVIVKEFNEEKLKKLVFIFKYPKG